MHELILWAGFLGAWLLVAGPVYQASLELAEEDFRRERFADAMQRVGRPDPVSPWWWLLPPIHMWLSHRHREQWQDAFMLELDDEQYDALSRYRNKAYGWMVVGLGGLLIATKETWELVEGYEWPTWALWVLILAALVLSLGHTAGRRRRDTELEARRRTTRVGADSATGST